MNTHRHIILYHHPQSRSGGTRILLEELHADYEVKVVNYKTGETRKPEYLAINPMGKIPAIKHGDTVITEQAAIYMYLADLYPEAKMAPVMGDPLRGAYMRWMVFYGSCFEPAVLDHADNRAPSNKVTSPYGDYDTTFDTMLKQFSKGPWFLGDTYTALDVLWGQAFIYSTTFNLIPKLPEIMAYIERFNARPAVIQTRALDAELAAKMG